MSNITEKLVVPDVAMALDNLAFAAISKMDALDTLVTASKELADELAHVTKENEKLLNLVSQLANNAQKLK